MRVLPNMTVLTPVDAVEVPKVVRVAAALNGPVYIRLNRNDMPIVTELDTPFEVGKPLVLAEGRDISVCVNGITAGIGLKARELLEKHGISVRVVNFSTIKPLDEAAVRSALAGTRALVTVEEHSVIGGLGSTILELLSDDPVPTARIGITDRYGQSAHDYGQLLEHYGLTAEAIERTAMKILKK